MISLYIENCGEIYGVTSAMVGRMCTVHPWVGIGLRRLKTFRTQDYDFPIYRWLSYKISSDAQVGEYKFFGCFDKDLWTLNNHLITYWTFKKCVIKTSQVVSSKYGIALDILTYIFENWIRITNLKLTNWFIPLWIFKKCAIKTSQVVSSKYEIL